MHQTFKILAMALLLIQQLDAYNSARMKRDDRTVVTFPTKETNAVKPVSGHHVLFEPIGSLVTTVSYIHLEVDLEYGQFVSQVHRFEEQLNLVENKARQEFPTYSTKQTTPFDWTELFSSDLMDQIITIVDLERLELENLKDSVLLLDTMLPAVAKEIQRHRRAFFSPLVLGLENGAAGALGVSGTLMGSYSQEDLNALGKSVHSSLDKVVKIITNHDHLLNPMDKNMQDMRMNLNLLMKSSPSGLNAQLEYQRKILARKIDHLIEVVQVASLHRLSAKAVSAAELKNAFTKLQEEAKKQNLNLVAAQPGHLLQLETTLMRKGSSELVLIVHVPLINPEHEFSLFRYHSVPMIFESGATLLIQSVEELLAVGLQGDHEILTVEDLEKCHKFTNLYLCEHNSVSNLYSNATCLAALHQLDEEGVRNLCLIKSGSAEETVYQLDHDRFLIYLPKALNVKMNCVGKRHTHIHLPEGHADLVMEPGCTANLQRHKLTTGTSSRIKGRMTHFVWDWNPLLKFTDLSKEEVYKGLKRVNTKSTRGILLEDLRKDIARQQRENTWLYHSFGITAGSVGTSIVTFVILVITLLCLCHRRKQIMKCFKPPPADDVHYFRSNQRLLLPIAPPPSSPSSIYKC